MPSDEEWLDADMTAEAALGKPFPATPEEGLARMKQRVELLQKRLDELRTKPWGPDSDGERELIREIRDANNRLHEYETQLKGRN